MEHILEKAKELGIMIRECAEMARISEAEAEMTLDEKAKMLTNEYRLLQIEMAKAAQGGGDTQQLEDIKSKLLAKYEEMDSYEVTHNYFEAKVAFDNIIQTVNNVLTYTISGQESCSGGSCSTCGGCK